MIKTIHGFIFSTFILLFFFTANAQDKAYSLSLLIKDKSTKLPLQGAELSVNGKKYQADADGNIVLNFPSMQNFHAKFSSVGYNDLDVHFYPKNPVENDTVFLSQGSGNLEQVTVIGYRVTDGVNSIAPATVLTQSDLDKTRGETLAHLLQTIPGVNMLQTGNTIAKPVVDGLYGNRVLVINNGVRQEGQQWGLEHAPEVDPNIAQNITVVKGADAVRYGAEALGGVILLDPAPLPYNDPALHGEVNVNGVSNGRGGSGSATLSSSLKGIPELAWRIQGSYSKLGDYQTKNYFLENTGTEQKSFSGTIGYQGKHFGGQVFYSRFQTSLGISLASDIGSPADLIVRMESRGPYVKGDFSYNYSAPYQKVLHQLFKAGIYYNTDDGSRFEVNYNLQIDHRQEFSRRRADRLTIPINDWILHTNTLEGTWQKTFAEKWHTMAGVNLRAQSNYNDTITLSNPFIPNYSANSVGVFGTEHLTLNDKVDLEAGARFDYQKFNALSVRWIYKYITEPNGVTSAQGAYYQFGGDRRFGSFSFISGALWKINHLWNLRSNLGLAWRTPNPEELYSYGLNQGANKFEYGDSALKSEHGYKWITTLTKAGDRFSFAANIYLQYIQNYIYLTSADSITPTLTGFYPVFKYEQTNAFLKGIDFDGKYNFGNDGKLFQYEFKASLIRAYDLTNDAYLPNIPSDRYTNSLQWNIPLSNKMTDNYLQLNYMYVTRQTRYEPNSDYAPPPGPYGLWGLTAGTKFLLGNGGKSLTVNISVDNLFNIAYRDYLDSWRYYTDEIGRNIQLHAIFRF